MSISSKILYSVFDGFAFVMRTKLNDEVKRALVDNLIGYSVDWIQSLKQFFINVSFHSNSDGSVSNRAIRIRLATSM